MKKIDLRSDTVTQPTEKMRHAMANAEVGDDVFEDDYVTKSLESKAAKLLKFEAGLFVPSGTFSNQLALFTHCEAGDEVIVDQDSHIRMYEGGTAAILARAQLYTLESHEGEFDLSKLSKIITKGNLMRPKTCLVCLENAYNGKVLSLDYIEAVSTIAHDAGVRVHLDGARLFNAAQFLNVEPWEIARTVDTLSICLSKGLGAPVGSILLGSKEFIEKARINRKKMGGGMRQTGILAAAGIIALEEMRHRLHEDHANANYLREALLQLEGITLDPVHKDINLVFFDMDNPKRGRLHEYLAKFNIIILPYSSGFRFVTHYGITQEDIDFVIQKMKDYLM